MKYTILITQKPEHPNSKESQDLAKNLIQSGHILEAIFFYHDGVFYANKNSTCFHADPSHTFWQNFTQTQPVPLYVCVAAATRREIVIDDQFFIPVGLGQLIEACERSDKLITFK